MSKRPRRNHAPAFKAKVALAAIKDDKTLASNLMFPRTRSLNGKRSCLKGWPEHSGLRFVPNKQQGQHAERKSFAIDKLGAVKMDAHFDVTIGGMSCCRFDGQRD
jgi:hypothetical protein